MTTGTTVTVNISTATSSTMTITGTLSFSRVTSSTLTMGGGNLSVLPGGKLDMGYAASPIPSTISASLILSSGTFAGQYGLTINNGGNFPGVRRSQIALCPGVQQRASPGSHERPSTLGQQRRVGRGRCSERSARPSRRAPT